MPFIIRRTEGNRNVVVLRYAALFYWLIWPTLVVTVLASVAKASWLYLLAALAWVVVLSVAIPYWPIIFKLKRLMKETAIQAQGSKYSFSNPLRYEWEERDSNSSMDM